MSINLSNCEKSILSIGKPKNQDYSSVYANQQEVIHNESQTTKLATPKRIIRKELVPDWLKAEQHQEVQKTRREVSLDQQLEMIQLKQDLGQELTQKKRTCWRSTALRIACWR
ncbi:hypothetical protein AAAC51_27425 [Priestia megaterium]